MSLEVFLWDTDVCGLDLPRLNHRVALVSNHNGYLGLELL